MIADTASGRSVAALDGPTLTTSTKDTGQGPDRPLALRILYVVGEAYDGFSPGAMWQDAKVGVHTRKAWERIAVVSDHRALLDAPKVFAWMAPGEARTYPMAELDDAKAWLSET